MKVVHKSEDIKMSEYEKARDEAAKKEPCDIFQLHCCVQGFIKGSDFGKSYSDKMHEGFTAELRGQHEHALVEIEELKKHKTDCDLKHNDYEILEEKLTAQDAIIAKMEEALNCCKNDYWFMANLLEHYSTDKDQSIKDCIERMNFRKPIFNVLTSLK